MKRLLPIPVVLAAGAAFLASALPAFSADTGTVTAQVTVQTACITLDKSSLDFGSQPFSQPGATWGVSVVPVIVTNCGAAAKLFGRGTDAKTQGQPGTTPDVWTLDDSSIEPCSLGVNRYKLQLGGVVLSTSDKQLLGNSLGSGAAVPITNHLSMPCTGSDGSGRTMGWTYVFTATL